MFSIFIMFFYIYYVKDLLTKCNDEINILLVRLSVAGGWTRTGTTTAEKYII